MKALLILTILSFVLSVGTGFPETAIMNTFKAAKTVAEILEGAEGVAAFIDGIFEGETDETKFDQEKLLSDMEAHMDAVKVEILSSIILRSKLERIDDAKQAITSSIMDLKEVLKAKTGVKELLRIFIDRYEEHDVILHVRFLKTLLTYVTPGDNVDLITLVREETRCGGTAMSEFWRYYLNLIGAGAFLDICYLSATTQNVSIAAMYDEWKNILLEVDTTFRDQKSICNMQFPENVHIDLENNNDPYVLKSKLDQRYPNRTFDIIFYSGVGGKQFHSFHHSEQLNNFYWVRELDTANKVLVLTESNGKPSWNTTWTKTMMESCIQGYSVDKDDELAAENFLKKLFTCHDLMYPLGVVIVYFEADDYLTKAVIENPESPVVELTLGGVTLEYCFESTLACMVDKKETSGQFRVFLYPNYREDIKPYNFKLSGSQGNHEFVWPWTILVPMGLYMKFA